MLLDAPAFQLRLKVDDVLGILEGILKERHWRNFDLANLNLHYVPFWFFNYDIYQEVEGRVETFSSRMALNAVTGKLEPILIQVSKAIKVDEAKEITHDVEFEVRQPAIDKAEAKQTAIIKIAGELRTPKDTVSISGLTLKYVPIWRIYVSLAHRTQRMDIDGISGSPLNVEEVPTRERGFMEVTADMLEDLKTPEGWVDYSKKAFDFGASVITGTGAAIGKTTAKEGGGLMKWLIGTRTGHMVGLAAIAILLLLVFILR